MQRFTELRVWQRSHQLALSVYRETATFPADERYGLVGQVRRAVVSVSSNIAEGAKRKSSAEYARLLDIAEGSLAETESLLRISSDLGFDNRALTTDLIRECEDIARMLNARRESVEAER